MSVNFVDFSVLLIKLKQKQLGGLSVISKKKLKLKVTLAAEKSRK